MASCLEYHRRIQHQSSHVDLLSGTPRSRGRRIPPNRSHAHGFSISAWTSEEPRFRNLWYFGGLWFLWGNICCWYCRPVFTLGILFLDRRHHDSNIAHNIDLFDSILSIKGNVLEQGQNGLRRGFHYRLGHHPHSLCHHPICTRPLGLANAVYPSVSWSRYYLSSSCSLLRDIRL